MDLKVLPLHRPRSLQVQTKVQVYVDGHCTEHIYVDRVIGHLFIFNVRNTIKMDSLHINDTSCDLSADKSIFAKSRR